MGPKKVRNASGSEDQAALALRLVELLNDDQVLDKPRRVLYPRELSDKINSVNAHVHTLHAKLDEKEQIIRFLEEKVAALEASADSVDQYGRRANLHVRGIPEQADPGESTDELVLDVLNNKMGMTPPVQKHQLVRSHRLGRIKEGQDRQRHPRPIIVRFCSERLRDEVFKARTTLKPHDEQHRDSPAFLNDDLTALRGKLAYDARIIKREKKIADTWTAYGKVLVKTLTNQVQKLKTAHDLNF